MRVWSWLFKQCFEPANTLFTETCSEVGPLNLMYISETQQKIQKKLFVSDRTSLEFVAGISAYCHGNAGTQESMS